MAKILLVEDDMTLKLTYDIILMKSGHDVQRAEDGEQALELANKNDFDLILLDMMMPKMGGLEFLRAYDLVNKHPDVKVIVFTNMETTEFIDEAYKLGAKKYMIKSQTSPRKLEKLIEEVLAA